MELLSIEQINEQYLRYIDQRSCKNWLRAKGLSIIKMGKKYFVQEDQFNAVLNKITRIDKKIQTNRNPSLKQKPVGFENIYDGLLKTINEL